MTILDVVLTQPSGAADKKGGKAAKPAGKK